MSYKAWAGLLAWFAFVLLLLKVAEAAKLRDFDPAQKLIQKSMQSNFDQNFTQTLQAKVKNLSNTVIHLRTEQCFCEVLAETHSSELSSELKHSGFNNITVNINQVNALTEFVPSTPAVAIFNKQKALIYLGPYSVGLGCITNNSLTQKISQLSQQTYRGALINADVKGCYCAT